MVLLYVDEKRPVTAAKILGDTSCSSIKVKVQRAQKLKGILDVFKVEYNHIKDSMGHY